MSLETIFKDASLKAKARVVQVGEWLLSGELPVEELLVFSETQKATDKATCIEAIEYATHKKPDIADEHLLDFVTLALKADEPRIKWESAKVIGNICSLFPDRLSAAIKQLLINANHTGTVVRWASAYALAEILKLKTVQNKKLVPAAEQLSEQETDNGVRKKYLDALRRLKNKY